MSQLEPSYPDLQRLLDRLHDGDFTSGEHDELAATLEMDQSARQRYCQYWMLHTLLRVRHTNGLALQTQIRGIRGVDLALLPQGADFDLVRNRDTLSVWHRVASIAPQVRQSATWSIMAVAALFYGVFAFFAWNLRPNDPLEIVSIAEESVATLGKSANVQWSQRSAARHEGASIGSGESLQLSSGTLELEFKTGTKLSIEGPADWTMDGRNAIVLRSGKMLARVPSPARGFTVGTPATTIVDLGTEFGVDVDVTGRTDVQVIQGLIEVKYALGAESSKRHSSSLRMTAGSAKRFSQPSQLDEPVTVQEISPWLPQRTSNDQNLARQPSLPTETVYAAAVLADQPLGYWRLSDEGTAADLSGNHYSGRYLGFVSTKARGLFTGTNDRSAHFIGPKGEGWLEVDDFPMPPSFTIEIWVRSDTPLWSADGWFLSMRELAPIIVGPEVNTKSWAFHVFRDKQWVTAGRHVPSAIDDHFHQYVLVYDVTADQASMHFDGGEVFHASGIYGESRRRTSVKTSFSVGHDQTFGSERCGDGYVDELAIYPRALSSDSVRKHFQAVGASLNSVQRSLQSDPATRLKSAP